MGSLGAVILLKCPIFMTSLPNQRVVSINPKIYVPVADSLCLTFDIDLPTISKGIEIIIKN